MWSSSGNGNLDRGGFHRLHACPGTALVHPSAQTRTPHFVPLPCDRRCSGRSRMRPAMATATFLTVSARACPATPLGAAGRDRSRRPARAPTWPGWWRRLGRPAAARRRRRAAPRPVPGADEAPSGCSPLPLRAHRGQQNRPAIPANGDVDHRACRHEARPRACRPERVGYG